MPARAETNRFWVWSSYFESPFCTMYWRTLVEFIERTFVNHSCTTGKKSEIELMGVQANFAENKGKTEKHRNPERMQPISIL